MNWLYAFLVLVSFFAAFLATGLALFAWQRRTSSWARPFAVMMLALAEWSLTSALILTSTEVAAKEFWQTLQFLGVALAPTAWFIFAASYTGRQPRLLAGRQRLLYLFPFITILLVLTNSSHNLIWRSVEAVEIAPSLRVLVLTYGPWFWLHVAYSYLLLVVGSAFFLQSVLQARGEYRWHTFLIYVGSVAPWVGNALYITNLSPGRQLDLTPVAFAGGGAILAWGILRQHLFDLVPVARQTVLDSIPDGVVVINAQDRIVDINPVGEAILGTNGGDLVGRRLVEVKPEWASLWYKAVTSGEAQTEVSAEIAGKERCYDLCITPVHGGREFITGRLIVLRDITEHKKTEEELVARQKLFEKLVAVARATAEGPSLQATLQNALDVAATLTESQYGSLFLLDSSGRVTHSILARGKTPSGSRREIVGTVMDKGLAGWALRHRRSALVSDTVEDDRWVTLPNQPYAVRSVLVVPIISGSEVPGVLTLQHSQPNHFEKEDETLLRAASDQMALALRNAQIYDEQRRLADRQETLYEALRTIGEHLEPGTVVHLAVDKISGLTGWPTVAILVPNSRGDTLKLEGATGRLANSEGREFALNDSECGHAYRTGRTQMRWGSGQDGEPEAEFPQLRSAVFVPLRHGQERIGVFAVGSEEAGTFDDDDVLLAESLAEAVALAIANAQLFKAVADEHSRLQALIESSRDGIILVGSDQQILVLNHTALALMGIDDEPEVWMYRPLPQMLRRLGRSHPKTVRAALTEISRINGGEAEGTEGEIELGSQALRWMNLPVRSDQGAVGRLIVLQDVTQERALQRMRDDLTHTMVHDMRNPLNIVSGSLEMLEDRLGAEPSSDVGQMLNISRQSAQRMLNMVNGILNISRLESGHMPLNRTQVDVSELIRDVLDAQSALAREKNLNVRFSLAGDVPHIDADKELLERIVQNLVGNAIKFTPPEGEIVVSLNGTDSMLQVSVSDTGAGIPAEIQDQLFEKFVTGVQMEKGSGLGLAFCRMAVEAHGGEIWAESEVGQGARFTFTLPLSGDGNDHHRESERLAVSEN